MDATFSEDGFARSALGSEPGALGADPQAITIAPDGRPTIAGGVLLPWSCLPRWGCGTRLSSGIARFTRSGELDATLAGDGELENREFDRLPGWSHIAVTDIAVQEDGKTLLVGSSDARETWIGRLTEAGEPDPDFGGGDGTVSHDFFGGPYSSTDQPAEVEIDREGRIVIAGIADLEAGELEYVLSVVRLLPDGSVDSDFAGDGSVVDQSRDYHHVGGMTLTSDGRIVVVGNLFGEGAEVRALGTGGFPDNSLSQDGAVSLSDYNEVTDVASDETGRIVLLAQRDVGRWDSRPEVVRLTRSGEIDRGFGTGGTAAGFAGPEVAGHLNSVRASELAVDAAARVYVGGSLRDRGGGRAASLVGRLDSAGDLDPTFGIGGWAPVFLRHAPTDIADMAIRNDGLYAVGRAPGGGPVVSRRSLAGGPFDLDADGVRNDADECAHLFGACPFLERKIFVAKRRAGRAPRRLFVTARIGGNCAGTVKLWRKRPGRDRVIARGAEGAARKRLRDGLRAAFYATAPKAMVGYGYCNPARSKSLRIPTK